jgi:diguanylate cyclase (GGDEF)-like protein/PAS domain S-box-containing protein
MIVNRHLSKTEVEAYYSGRLFQPKLAIVEEHLGQCDHCLTRLGVIVLRHSLGRNRSEREVEKSLISLAMNVESSDNAIIGANPDGTIVSWNLGAELLFRHTSQETIGEKVEILGPRGPRNDSSKILTTFRIGRAAPPFVSVSRRKDGSPTDNPISVSAIRNRAREVVGPSTMCRYIGQRLLGERKLRESEERFREVFEHAPIGMCVSGLDARIIQANAAFCRMLGYSGQELLGKAWTELTHPDDLKSCLSLKNQLRADPDGCLEAEKRYVHCNGTIVWARIKISVVRDSCGHPAYHVVHVEDISERKRTEEALHESEDRFRITADGCPTMMWVADATGETQFINRAYREFCGITLEQIEGGKWQLLLHSDDVVEYVAAFHRAVRDHVPFNCEVRVRRADGEWRWLATYAEPRFSPGGEYLGHVGLCPDVTEVKRTEEARQSSEENFRQMAENIREVIWMMTPETGEIVYVSPAYEQVWGRTCDGLYENPRSWLDAIHPEDLEMVHLSFARQQQGEALDSEYRIRTPDGKEKWIRDRAFPVRDHDGQLIRIVGIAEEITERKLYETELIRARELANARSRVLEKINRRDPLDDVLGTVSELLKQQFPGSDYCIHLSTGGDDLEVVPKSCSSPDVAQKLRRVALDAHGEICAHAAVYLRRIADRERAPAYSWPVLDANGQIQGTISVFTRGTTLPDSFAEVLDLTAQLVALAINSRRLYDGLTHQSHHDALTGLPNRVFLDEHLASITQSAAGSSGKFAIAYIDLDEFKKVNDIYGHTTGDTFLEIAVARFRSVLRQDDVLARIGGDEFIAVLASIEDRPMAVELGHRLLESLNEPFAISGALRLPCTASIGIAMFPDDASTIDELKHCADESMYVAKTAGKNQLQSCDPMGIPKKLFSAAELRGAIEENRLRVHYQPIFLAKGRLSGFEALVRIEDGSGKLVAPTRFIDIAEKSNLVVPLGLAVLRQACRQAAVWERETGAGLKMAVNVSARQFAHPAFFKDVLTVLAEVQLSERLLELEITEAAILWDLDGAIEQITELRSRGVRIAIDDFGTGYSTLSLVHRLPLDVIKIDRSFVQDSSLDGPGIHSIKAILTLASGLKLQSVAEGIEHAIQLQTLLSLGCGAFQGYGLARPMSALSVEAQMEGWMRQVPCVTDRLQTDSHKPEDYVLTSAGYWHSQPNATERAQGRAPD